MSDFERAVAFMDELDERCADRIVPFSHGRAYVNEQLPLVHDLNYLRATKPGATVKKLAAEAERIQGPLGHRHRRVNLWDGAEAERLEPEFAAREWRPQRFVVMAHRKDTGRASKAEVREVGFDTLRPVWTAGIMSEPFAKGDRELVRQLVEHKALTERSVPTRFFAAFAHGEVASYCELYSFDGIGQVEAVLTLPEHRGKGLASAVVLTALAASQDAGNRLSFLVADADDWPKELYAKLGFETVGRYERFLLLLG
jgi:ribosomal protein S18 acetylase RimI-like enzyme